MNKNLLKHIAFFLISILAIGCNDSESDLLKARVFFEEKEHRLETDGQASMTYDIISRLSKPNSASVDVSYEIVDASVIEAYNKKNGKNYGAYNTKDVNLDKPNSSIESGKIYSEKSVLSISNLDKLEEGQDYMIAVRVKSTSMSIMEDNNILYIVISNPIRIMKVGQFKSNSVKVPLAAGRIFQSVTYEALIYIDRFGNNNTVMGCEGVLILRIGDDALPGKANNLIQIAGDKQFYSSQAFEKNRWYHVAFTYDHSSGKATIYINGERAADATWDNASFDLTSDGGGFFVGKVAGFMWGERPLYGALSEVRLWSVARTQAQIKQSMLNVDPKSNGLAVYYKFDGTDQYQEGSTWQIKDMSGNNMNGLVNGGIQAIDIKELTSPVKIE